MSPDRKSEQPASAEKPKADPQRRDASDAAEEVGTKLRDGERPPEDKAPDGAVSPRDLNSENDDGAG